MITVEQFNLEFSNRHNLIYEDFDFLVKKYTHITFKDIPEAWVCPIDQVLSKLKEPLKVHKIQQYYGFLLIENDHMINEDWNLLDELDKTIRLIDWDLYDRLESGIELQ